MSTGKRTIVPQLAKRTGPRRLSSLFEQWSHAETPRSPNAAACHNKPKPKTRSRLVNCNASVVVLRNRNTSRPPERRAHENESSLPARRKRGLATIKGSGRLATYANAKPVMPAIFLQGRRSNGPRRAQIVNGGCTGQRHEYGAENPKDPTKNVT